MSIAVPVGRRRAAAGSHRPPAFGSVAQFISTTANCLQITGYCGLNCAKVWNRQAFGSVLKGAITRGRAPFFQPPTNNVQQRAPTRLFAERATGRMTTRLHQGDAEQGARTPKGR